MNPPRHSGRKQPKCFFMRAQIIHNQMDSTSWPVRKHVFQPKYKARICRFVQKAFADGLAGMRAESSKQLKGAIALISIWPTLGRCSPDFTAAWDSLQGSHFVKADHLAPAGPMTVDVNYSVFFTSNSGSVLSHQV